MSQPRASQRSSRPSASPLLPGARCASHDRPATGLCARCGDYLCGACGLRVDDRLYCRGCATRLTAEHSRRATYALVTGLLAMHGVFPLAPVALVLGGSELAAIRAGEAPLGGRLIARAGLVLGACGLAIPVSVLLLWFAAP